MGIQNIDRILRKLKSNAHKYAWDNKTSRQSLKNPKWPDVAIL